MSTDAVVPQRPYLAPPDDLTVPQLMFSYDHPTRPVRPKDLPCLIDDETGRAVYFEDVRAHPLFRSILFLFFEHGVALTLGDSSKNARRRLQRGSGPQGNSVRP